MCGLGVAPGELGIRIHGAGLDELDRDHGAAAADVADLRMRSLQSLQALAHDGLDRERTGVEVLLLHGLDRAESRCAGDRIPTVGAAEAADVHGVHDLGATGHAREGQATGDSLGRGDEVGDDGLMLAGKPLAGAAEA